MCERERKRERDGEREGGRRERAGDVCYIMDI